ncbi:hypothetical protein BpHYR1_048868 [Brachionus plicatilis]|uniref:Uncharacterized protein n=1 Tax=Brachionus plicatilis TaxID=10195 RepID=A0A3M7Q847_BRAPC|nr:hypothetical protein BpHYR1_048868 [Brachionus plicatilis]
MSQFTTYKANSMCLKKAVILLLSAIYDILLQKYLNTAMRDNSQGCPSKRSSQLVLVVFDFKGVYRLNTFDDVHFTENCRVLQSLEFFYTICTKLYLLQNYFLTIRNKLTNSL